ncbi:MAG: hypothetical protein ACLTZN_08465 [Streptococcus sp.]
MKLIAIDMDGTLQTVKEIPVENIQAIQEAAAAGMVSFVRVVHVQALFPF